MIVREICTLYDLSVWSFAGKGFLSIRSVHWKHVFVASYSNTFNKLDKEARQKSPLRLISYSWIFGANRNRSSKHSIGSLQVMTKVPQIGKNARKRKYLKRIKSKRHRALMWKRVPWWLNHHSLTLTARFVFKKLHCLVCKKLFSMRNKYLVLFTSLGAYCWYVFRIVFCILFSCVIQIGVKLYLVNVALLRMVLATWKTKNNGYTFVGGIIFCLTFISVSRRQW